MPLSPFIDPSEAIQALVSIGQNVGRTIEANAAFIGSVVAEFQQDMAPFDTGQLASSIHYSHVESDGQKISIVNLASAEYATFQEFGTGYLGDKTDYNGYPIVHTLKGSWAYIDPLSHELRIGRPMPGRHFMAEGAEIAADRVADILTDFIEGVFD